MSIGSDVKKDIKAAQRIWLPWRVLLPFMVICVPIFWLFDQIGSFNMALPALNCFGMFGFLIYLKRDISHKPWFWVTITIAAILHAALIWYIPWTASWVPALAIAFISSLDICILLWILAVVSKFRERNTN